MILTEERDAAIDQVHHNFIATLRDWLRAEKGNLDAFIATPTEHANYDPFVQPDFNALTTRSGQLGQASQALNVIILYKQGLGPTRSQHDMALNALPSVLMGRLLDWLKSRHHSMIEAASLQNKAPIKDYEGLFAFDNAKFTEALDKYKASIDGLEIVYQYTKEREV